jgi:putative transposase
VSYKYRLLPGRRQHRALESILESQRQLYNAALEERIGAYRKANVTRSYMDQAKALTEWRRCDVEARSLPANLQRATLLRLDRAYSAFFRRAARGNKPGFPRFKSRTRFNSFGFAEFAGIRLRNGRLRFKGLPGALRIHSHRVLPAEDEVKTCTFRRDVKGWVILFDVPMLVSPSREICRAVGVDLGIINFAALSNGDVIPGLRAARRAERRLRVADPCGIANKGALERTREGIRYTSALPCSHYSTAD